MKPIELKVKSRQQTRRTNVKKLRANERVPAVIYGKHNPPMNLEIHYKDILHLVHHSATEHLLVNLVIDEGSSTRLAFVQDIQHEALTGGIQHVDFHEVHTDEEVAVLLPIEPSGEAIGSKISGNVLEHVLFEVKVKGLPKDLPEIITVDVTQLEAGNVIHLSDVTLPEGLTLIGDPTTPVFSIAAVRAVEETKDEDAEEAPVVA